MSLTKLNNLPIKILRLELGKCCGSTTWRNKMIEAMPFTDNDHLLKTASESWAQCTEPDWLEAFSYHPRIGEKEIAKKFSSTAGLASNEQAGVKSATQKTISDLARLNEKYFEKFGFIFIIFASGKSAEEMLVALKARLKNDRDTELRIAAAEQLKITLLRLKQVVKI
jgi:2-oxo-4-hydroxy-4-carboxy-5-ureidoimidazoline decarboxylase